MNEKELGTELIFAGGNNKNRIGGSCSIIEHKYAKGLPPARIMVDLGALFAPNDCMDVDAAIPDVREYLDTEHSSAPKKIDAIFLTHSHEDHIGGLVHLARAGYKFPRIYASKGTLEILKEALEEAGVNLTQDTWKEKYIDENGKEQQREIFFEINPKKPINIMSNVRKNEETYTGIEVEAINMSHSALSPLGFHIMTTINGEPEAKLFHPGDYHLSKVRLGEGFNENDFIDLLNRKGVTHVLLDSTSSTVDDKFLIEYDEAVNNTVDVINQHSEKQVISAVISRSAENLAIHLDAARKTGRKIFLDGHWLKKTYKAMLKSGITEFEDIVFHGPASKYKSKFPQAQRYIITSGAFAESKKGAKSGLYKMSEQEKIKPNAKEKNSKNNSKETTKKIGHPDFDIDENTLIIGGQRCIEEINGKEVRAMYARLASLGAVIVVNDSDNPIGNFKTARLQRSGHAGKSETQKLIKIILNILKEQGKITFIPTHGNPKQMIETAKLVKDAGGKFYFANNLDVLKLNKKGVKKVDEEVSKLWIGVCEISDNTSPVKKFVYVMVNEDFETQGLPIKTVTVEIKPRNKDFLKDKDGVEDKGNKQKENRKQNGKGKLNAETISQFKSRRYRR